MNKRSAIFLAAGLTVALVAGGFALSQELVGPSPSSAAVSTHHHKKAKPVVRTHKRTITVHRKAKGSAPSGTVAPAPAPTYTAPSMTSTSSAAYSSDDSHDSHDSYDDGYGSGGGGSRGSGDD